MIRTRTGAKWHAPSGGYSGTGMKPAFPARHRLGAGSRSQCSRSPAIGAVGHEHRSSRPVVATTGGGSLASIVGRRMFEAPGVGKGCSRRESSCFVNAGRESDSSAGRKSDRSTRGRASGRRDLLASPVPCLQPQVLQSASPRRGTDRRPQFGQSPSGSV